MTKQTAITAPPTTTTATPTPTPTPPTVAFVTHSAQLAGAEIFLLRVTSAMRRVHPLVVLGEHGPLEHALAERGIDTVVLPLDDAVQQHAATSSVGRSLLRGVSGVVGAARALARLCRERDVALIASQSAKSHVYAGLAGRIARRPVLVHQHSVIGGTDASRANALVLRTAIALVARRVVANSRTTARAVGRLRPIEVIGCPVAPVPSVPPVPEGAPEVLVLGRLSEIKGQDIAIRAFARARQLGLPSDVRLRLVGAAMFDRDAAFEATLRDAVRETGLGDAVEITGHRDDVAAEFARSTVVVHPGRVAEGFGQAIAEAMAAGRPVIATDLGGAAELVGRDAGVLVPAGDVEALARAMHALVPDVERRERLAETARARVRAFEPTVVVERLEDALLAAAR